MIGKSVIVLILAFSAAIATAVPAKAFRITSSAFAEGAGVPGRFTCDGKNVPPALAWENVPKRAKSLVLIVEDPDAPSGLFVHWVLFNMSPARKGLPEGFGPVVGDRIKNEVLVNGGNGTGKTGYTGPCPPSGTHRYTFRLLALDSALFLKPGATRAQVLQAAHGHVVAECALMGKYKRK